MHGTLGCEEYRDYRRNRTDSIHKKSERYQEEQGFYSCQLCAREVTYHLTETPELGGLQLYAN